jgi:hypothetical protein
MTTRTMQANRTPQRGADVPEVRVRSISVVAARKVAQLTDGTWNVVLTAADKGTFLIRGRKDGAASSCPLHEFEVRRIDAVDMRS